MGITPKYTGTETAHNYFGNEADDYIHVTSAGAKMSTNGVAWTPLASWIMVGNVVMIPSVEDGDMVVVNAVSLTVDVGMVLTTLHRCRGLLIYWTDTLTNNGDISMDQRGCHANPTDAVATANTPVPPSDGHAVPADGLILRKLAAGYTGTHTGPLLYGCGLAAVTAEANQPEVKGNGIVVPIPRVGGLGGVGSTTNDATYGTAGSTAAFAPGGGGAGGRSGTSGDPGDTSGGNATCFCAGPGGGGAFGQMDQGEGPTPGDNYGGPGGDADVEGNRGGGGAGNPPGDGLEPGLGRPPGLGILCGHNLAGSGIFSARGIGGGDGYGSSSPTAGGASGGGCWNIFYSGTNTFTGSWDVSGGVSNGIGGGDGGAGSVNGPYKIDPPT
jgi:hypothetical protein